MRAVRAQRGLLAAVFLFALHTLDFSFGWTPNLSEMEKRFQPDRYTIEVWKTKDDYCPLDVTATYPFVVKVFDKRTGKVTRQGVLLSHQAVLTTAREFGDSRENYLVVAHRVFTTKGFSFKTCYQTRKVIGVYHHPKYDNDYPLDAYALAFRILALERQFDASPNFVYPNIPIHKSPYEYIQFLRRVMVNKMRTSGCELPRLEPPDSVDPYLSPIEPVRIRPHDSCITSLCKRTNDLPKCKEYFIKFRNYTVICAEFVDTVKRFVGGDSRFGSPLVCNGSAVGLTVAAMKPDHVRGIWAIVSTFIRVWPWLMTHKDAFWNSSFGRKGWDSEFIEDHRLYFNAINKRRQNKNVTLEGSRIKFLGSWLKRAVPKSTGWRIDYLFTIYSTGVLMSFLMF